MVEAGSAFDEGTDDDRSSRPRKDRGDSYAVHSDGARPRFVLPLIALVLVVVAAVVAVLLIAHP